jgi:hippurate hydrolase
MICVMTLTQDRIDRMIGIRRHIHAHPELSFQENNTSDLVADILQKAGYEVHRGLGGTGVVGTLRMGNGPSIGIRADMDALPISESGEVAHCSKVDGVMHACGHDGHTAMLLCAAEALAENPDFSGTVHLIFQPAEEDGGGGNQMVEDGLFRLFPCDAIFAIHNWPGLPAGQVAVRPGAMMASVDSFWLTLTGEGGHAAMPHQTNDPLIAASELVLALQTIVSRKVNPMEPAVVSVTQVRGGSADNVTPEIVEMKGTVRCFSPTVRAMVMSAVERMVASVCAAHEIKAELDFKPGYPSTINTADEAKFVAEVAGDLFGAEHVLTGFDPSMAAEDFSFMLEEVPGAYIWLGIGEAALPLHNPGYDFNDEVLGTGAELFVSLVRRFCPANT